MTSPTSNCPGVFRQFDPNTDVQRYFSDRSGPALDTTCQAEWQRGRTDAVFDVAAAVAVGGMRNGSWDSNNGCGILGNATAAETYSPRPSTTIPAAAALTNYYGDQGGGLGAGGGGLGAGGEDGQGLSGWEGKARNDDGKRGLCIDQVDDEGRFIRLVNDSTTQDEEIGCCVLRQAFQGHSIIEFHFPPAIFLPAGSSVTVWSSEKAKAGKLQSPDTDDEPGWNFHFKELFRWASGHDYLTTLCRPNGQVIAASSQSFGSYGRNSSEESVDPSPRIISKFNFITNRYKMKEDQQRAVKGSISAEFAELLKKKTAFRFQPRIIRRDGTQAKPKGGKVRQSPSYQPDPCFPLIYPD